MLKFLFFVLIILIIAFIFFYELSFNTQAYDIIAINRITKKGLAMNYRTGFQVWCLGCDTTGGIIDEKILFGGEK